MSKKITPEQLKYAASLVPGGFRSINIEWNLFADSINKHFAEPETSLDKIEGHLCNIAGELADLNHNLSKKPTQGLTGSDSELQMACGEPKAGTPYFTRLPDEHIYIDQDIIEKAKTEYQIPRVEHVGESVKFSPEEIKRAKDQLDYRTRLLNEIEAACTDPDCTLPKDLKHTHTEAKQTLTDGQHLWNVVLKPQCKCDSHEYQMCYPLEKYKQIRARSITAAVSLVYELYPELSSTYRVISVTEVEE